MQVKNTSNAAEESYNYCIGTVKRVSDDLSNAIEYFDSKQSPLGALVMCRLLRAFLIELTLLVQDDFMPSLKVAEVNMLINNLAEDIKRIEELVATKRGFKNDN